MCDHRQPLNHNGTSARMFYGIIMKVQLLLYINTIIGGWAGKSRYIIIISHKGSSEQTDEYDSISNYIT